MADRLTARGVPVQNFSEKGFEDFVRSGTVALPAPPVGEPFVDADDIADVAVAALTGDGHAGQLYELTGPWDVRARTGPDVLETTRGVVLVAAVVTTALQAGLYYAFACAVLPGLGRGDDRTFVAAMQQVNVAIINPWFLVTFLGAPVLAALAAVLSLSGTHRALLAWAALGAVFAVATFMITVALNVPLNNALAAAGDPDRVADLAAVHDVFAPAWGLWNTMRALSATVAVGCLALALVEHGRAAAG